MVHSTDTTIVNLKFLHSNMMGTSCRFGKTEPITDWDQDTFWRATSLLDDGDFDPDKYKRGENVSVEMPVWLAMKEGLI